MDGVVAVGEASEGKVGKRAPLKEKVEKRKQACVVCWIESKSVDRYISCK